MSSLIYFLVFAGLFALMMRLCCGSHVFWSRPGPSHDSATRTPNMRIPIIPPGMSLGLFLVIAYVACILFIFLFPNLILNHALLTPFLPGFKLLDWPNFLLGLVESFGYGWVVALVFGPLFNFFSARQS